MAKAKKTRRMKKQVRRAIGAVFLASSIAVAAIPTSSTPAGQAEAYADSAADRATKLLDASSAIPIIPNDATIYTTGDGEFQFAYVNASGQESGTRFAVLLGYSHSGALDGGRLEIPNTVDAYLQFNGNQGTGSGYCAVGKSGNFLFYRTEKQTTTADVSEEEYETRLAAHEGDVTYEITGESYTAEDVSGDDTMTSTRYTVTTVIYEMEPCYYTTYAGNPASTNVKWNDDTTLYYYYDDALTDKYRPSGDNVVSTNYHAVNSVQDYERITGADVAYIGNQYLTQSGSTWSIAGTIGYDTNDTDADHGVFAGNTNISTLVIGSNLSGIGKYAFYNCSVQSVSLANGLDTIDACAFKNCTSLKNVEFIGTPKLSAIGAYAFASCRNLTSFSVPISVTRICDGAFQNCTNLSSLYLDGGDETSARLAELGYFVFENCSSLQSLTFPFAFEEEVEITAFLGCASLLYIRTSNTTVNFVEGIENSAKTAGNGSNVKMTWDDFKALVSAKNDGMDKFYFEGTDRNTVRNPSLPGELHKTCTNNEIAFKYLDEDYYERTVNEYEGTDKIGSTTFQVNSKNELVYTNVEGIVTFLNFPAYIGPYYIEAIGSGAFRDMCTLTRLSLPATISSVGDYAFMGCHNLHIVWFGNPEVKIGTEAFHTQEVGAHTCSTKADSATGKTRGINSESEMTNANNYPTVELIFVGEIDALSTPFQYAMNANNFYDAEELQSRQYILYCSGFPTCLTVQYNYNTITKVGFSELVDFPTYLEIQDYSTADYLTDSQRTLAATALTNYQNGTATGAQATFVESAMNLTIPSGIDAIKDGLFYYKTQAGGKSSTTQKMSVACYGLNKIEADVEVARYSGTPAYILDADVSGNEVIKTAAGKGNGYNPVSYAPTVTVNTVAFRTTDGTYQGDYPAGDFVGCDGLIGFYLYGDDVRELEQGAFYDCAGLGLSHAYDSTAGKNVEFYAPVSEVGDLAFAGATNLAEVSFYNSVDIIGERAFAGDTDLATVRINGDVNTIERYAFENCENLKTVSISNSLTTLQTRPFKGCTSLETVDFQDSTHFVCDNSIIFGLLNGSKSSLIECLEGRTSKYITRDETAGITSIAQEAFADTPLREVDLEDSSIQRVPTLAFQNTPNLNNVKLPYSCTAISNYAFDNSKVNYIEATQYLRTFATHAFDHLVETGYVANGYDYTYDLENGTKITVGTGDHGTEQDGNVNVTMSAPEGSDLAVYAEENKYEYSSVKKTTYFTVKFYDYTADSPSSYVLVDTQSVEEGGNAVPPTPYGSSGKVFSEWNPDYREVDEDRSCYALYQTPDETYGKHKVTFYAQDQTTELGTLYIEDGGDATKLANANIDVPEISGYQFTGWMPSITKVTSDLKTVAQYTEVPDGSLTVRFYAYADDDAAKAGTYSLYYTYYVAPGGDCPSIVPVSLTDYTFTKWDRSITNVTADTDTYAQYAAKSSSGSGSDSNTGGNSGNGTSVTAPSHYVSFYSWDSDLQSNTLLYTTKAVVDGKIADPPTTASARQGYTFTGWSVDPTGYIDNSITSIFAVYSRSSTALEDEASLANSHYVRFYAWDADTSSNTKLVGKILVENGGKPDTVPDPTTRPGYTFLGWDSSILAIPEDISEIHAVYDKSSSADSGSTGSTGSDTQAGDYYTLTVVNGSGSGSYLAGSQVVIAANDPEDKLQFGSWTVSPATVNIASKALAATVLTMPSENVTVTANYVAKTSGSTNTGTGNTGTGNNTGNSTGGGTGSNENGGRTTVVIEKPGLTDTNGVINATVNGSPDNFQIKITESQAASEAVVRALINEYGSVDTIVYFPMDISLYDAAGTTKITDTTGLTVTITLPIPDTMRDYAGNNKVASILNNQLDVLTPRFSTISGVPCVTFTATHFSPYVIYVNTVQLTAGGEYDVTPKTGDGIHPKWFLSIGLFAISIFLFLKKDRKVAVKA